MKTPSKAEKKERLKNSLHELRYSKFKIDLRTGTLKRTVSRIIQSLRDAHRYGSNGHMFKRNLDDDIAILRDSSEAISAFAVEVEATANLAMLDICNRE